MKSLVFFGMGFVLLSFSARAAEPYVEPGALLVPRVSSWGDGQGVYDFSQSLAYTAPSVLVNTFPGFGLGSLAQGDGDGFRKGMLFDAVAWTFLGFGIATLNIDEDGPLSGPGVVSLLLGYGGYLASRAYGVARPVVFSLRNGVDPSRLFPPIFYNQLPGFGVGSYIQGDQEGGAVGSVLDISAFFLVGVLSGAALSGEIEISQAAGVGALVSFAAARVWGVVRPVRFRAGLTGVKQR